LNELIVTGKLDEALSSFTTLYPNYDVATNNVNTQANANDGKTRSTVTRTMFDIDMMETHSNESSSETMNAQRQSLIHINALDRFASEINANNETTIYLLILLLLESQNFIEKSRDGKFVECLEFAKLHLSKFYENPYLSTKHLQYLQVKKKKEEGRRKKDVIIFPLSSFTQEVMGLIAYQDPLNSPLSELLQIRYRYKVAQQVNALILGIVSSGLIE
jgi:hypothetical protein